MSGSNVRTYAGKFQAKINNDKGRLIGAWLFNNQLYIDITKTLKVTLPIDALRKMKVADLDILGLLDLSQAFRSAGGTTSRLKVIKRVTEIFRQSASTLTQKVLTTFLQRFTT